MKMEEMLRETLGKEIAQAGDEEIYAALLEIVQGLAKLNCNMKCEKINELSFHTSFFYEKNQ